MLAGVAALPAAAILGLPAPAAAALPAVSVSVVTTPLANTTQHTGVTVSAGCPSGTLVGGGSYLRNATNPATLPTNGLVLGGQSPSTGAAPVDGGLADGATDPTHWFTDANFTGVADPANLDQAATFALCATGGPTHTVVETATTTGPNAAQQVSPPTLTTATCGPGTRLIGGGALTSSPDQVNNGTTVGNTGNLKPLASYPSDAGGVAAANGSTGATSWTAYGSAGITAATDAVTAYALCSTDATTPPVAIARVDVAGPVAQAGTTTTTGSATCPAATQLLGGGYAADETVGATPGLQPQQGYHMRGSYPTTDATGASEVPDGAADPETWTALLQLGGQTLPAGDSGVLHVYAMCAMPPPPPNSADLSVTLTGAPNPVIVGQPLTYTLVVGNAGPAAATGITATEALPAGVTFVSASSTQGSCAQSGGALACPIGGLASGASATITVVVMPTQAVSLAAAATVSGDQPDSNTANNSVTATTMADLATRATPVLTAQPGGGTLGGSISDAVTLTGGSAPTGLISFVLFGPGDTNCAVALASSTAPVTGNGAYASAPFTATSAGAYRWVASYAGDGANAPAGPGACGDPTQTVSVRALPTLTTRALGSTALGGAISAQATLAGGSVVTGTIALELYGPGDTACTRSLATTTAAVSGNGIYGSRPFATTVSGTYRWVARYSGDARNLPAGPTSCAAPAAAITIAPRPPSPVNSFGLTSRTASAGGQLSVVVNSPGRGTFRVVASVRLPASGTRKAQTIRYGSVAATARAAGHLTLEIAPGSRARTLRRHHTRLTVTLAVTFTPTGGKPRTRSVHLTVKGTRR
ncbi:MAG TPA: DUF11 domain-containing protein [Solirubrobacteraceae bacterium]